MDMQDGGKCTQEDHGKPLFTHESSFYF